MRRAILASTVIVSALVAGCAGKSNDEVAGARSPAAGGPPARSGGSGGGSSGGGGGGSASAATLDVGVVTGLMPTFPVRFDAKDVVVGAIRLTATGGDATVKSLAITGAGTIDDAVDVDAVKIAVDDGDGRFDKASDAMAGGLARFAANDGKAIVGGVNRTVRAGATEMWWVVYDMAGSAEPGETLHANIAAAADVDALDANGRAAQVTGVPVTSPQGIVFVGEHLMFSEVVVTPTNGEFVEIFNPTAQVVDLSTYYLTDSEEKPAVSVSTGAMVGSDKHYFNLPSGTGFGVTNDTDFHVRFPAGATIRPGEFVVVALSSDAFRANYGASPTYEILQDGAADGVADMRLVGPAPVSWTAGLSNSQEILVLYAWDGQSDLVQDIDMVQWGSSINAFFVEKTGVSVDGPDQDTAGSGYKTDASMTLQDKAQPNSIGTSMKRVDFAEYGEVLTGGNGIGGHDETSENYGVTWSAITAPTPGTK